MYGITQSERSALDHLQARARHSRTGERWARQTQTHLAEINALTAVHPALRQAVSAALIRLADVDRGGAPLDVGTVAHLSAVLDALHREGGFELRRWASDLREELAAARGYTVADLLFPPAAKARLVAQGAPRQARSIEGISRLPEPSSATTT